MSGTKLDEKQVEKIMREMELFDTNCDGFVDLQEAHSVMEQCLGFSLDQTKALFSACDCNNDGRLNKDEFINFFFKMRDKIRELKNIFSEFDRDGSGHVSMEEAQRAMRNLGFTEEQIRTLVHAYDSNDDGQLQYDEFVKFWNAIVK